MSILVRGVSVPRPHRPPFDRRSVLPFLGACLGLIGLMGALSAPVFADDEEPGEPPFQSEGDLDLWVDLTGFRGVGDRTEQELYLSVANDQLVFEPVEEGFRGRIQLKTVVRDSTGHEVVNQEANLEPVAATRLDASDHGIQQVVRKQWELPPGKYHLEVSLTDEQALRPGLLNRMRNRHKKGEIETWFRVREFSPEEFQLSELAMIRNGRHIDADDPAGRSGVELDPNPSRYYGLALPTVRYFGEVYPGASAESTDTFLVHSEVRDLSGRTLVESRVRAAPEGASFAMAEELPVSENLPGGTYELRVRAMNERTREIVESTRPIEVIWAVDSWQRDPDRVLQEMILIMTDPEYKTLEKLSPGAREVYLAEFWHDVDPEPDSPENSVYREFRRRVELADHRYATGLRRGILTDRGRVLVRYGEPDDTEYEYSSSGFGPDAGDQRVAGPSERATLQARPSTSFLNPDEFREGDVSDVVNQRGGSTIKSKALEIWRYDGRGKSLRGKVDLQSDSHRGLKFIFADEMGNGEFQLIGSSGASVY
ncbi:MAG: GWxTD domain-containing protein [bacterium]